MREKWLKLPAPRFSEQLADDEPSLPDRLSFELAIALA
jgi:hypothetical protein